MNYNSGWVQQVLSEIKPKANELFYQMVDKGLTADVDLDTVEGEVALAAYQAYLAFRSGAV